MVKGKKEDDSNSLQSVFELVEKIERKFEVDSIKLSDGTKIWNIIRVILCFYPWKKIGQAEKEKVSFNKRLYPIFKSFLPIPIPNKKIDFCAFSDTHSRRLRNEKYYDVYVDPLYELLGDKFFVFEWPMHSGLRRDYGKNVYSNNYIPAHLPKISMTFFNIMIYRYFKRKNYTVESEKVLLDVIRFFSKNTKIDENRIRNEIYYSITVFYNMKLFFIKLLDKINPKAIFIRCGYGRFHNALSQACRELNIPSIELQHGNITRYHVGYVKTLKSENRDCVPEYLLTYGSVFNNIVQDSSLFDDEKVIEIGFPFFENIKKSKPVIDKKVSEFISNFKMVLLVTSQWTVADDIKEFIIEVSKILKEKNKSIGIIFKPHPRDINNYSNMKKHKNILLADKYDDIYDLFKVIHIHSTVYSTSGLEALAFGKPNIFIDIKKYGIKSMFEIIDEKTSYSADSPKRFIEKLSNIVTNYKSISKNALKKSEGFYKSNSYENLEKFLNSIKIKI